MSNEHHNTARSFTIENVAKVLDLANDKITTALNDPSNHTDFGVTSLSRQIEKELGLTFTVAYGLISTYVKQRSDIYSKRGANGGLKWTKDAPAKKANSSDSSDVVSAAKEENNDFSEMDLESQINKEISQKAV